jgi:uncharacterized membrane protein
MLRGDSLNGWTEFIVAFGVFLISHAVPAQPGFRAAMVAKLGERFYLLAYVIVSLAVLTWLIGLAGRAPRVELWPFEHWQKWAPNLAMPLVCILAALGVVAANPLSFGGNPNLRFDPQNPGIVGIVRHPLLWAIALWAAAHVVPNGDLAHVVLFGFFALIAVAGMVVIDRRKQKQLGRAAWLGLAARTTFWPLASLLTGRWKPIAISISPIRLAVGVAAYLTLLLSHAPIIGVSPLP